MLVVSNFFPRESEGPVKTLHGFVLLCFQKSEKFSSHFLYQDQETPPEARPLVSQNSSLFAKNIFYRHLLAFLPEYDFCSWSSECVLNLAFLNVAVSCCLHEITMEPTSQLISQWAQEWLSKPGTESDMPNQWPWGRGRLRNCASFMPWGFYSPNTGRSII